VDLLRSGGDSFLTIRFSEPTAQYQAHKASLDAAIRRVLDSGRFLSGVEVESLESEFAEFLGLEHAVGVANGTDALELALRGCGVGPGDEVITVSHTAVATVAAIQRSGADAVLVDIDQYFTLDPHQLSAAITERTKAIVPVHLYGQSADMQSIIGIAQEASLLVIEDCAQAHGATWEESRVGTLGDAASFSFYPTKNLGALGDAGMVVTREAGIADRVRSLREYGWNSHRESVLVGGNSRMDEIQAAVLRDKLTRLEAGNSRRAELADLYRDALQAMPIKLPGNRSGAQHVYHQFVIRANKRDELLAHLRDHDVLAGVHYRQPVHLQSAYRDRLQVTTSDLVASEQAAGEVLSLPIYPELTDEQLESVVGAIASFYNRP